MGLTHVTREECGYVMGYPNCVNETYGCMSSECVATAFASYGYDTRRAYVTFDDAYAIMSHTTGTINPQGMYHFMGIRGVRGGGLWVANSAPGYRSVWDDLNRSTFNSLGPVELVYVV
jgi:hypothetical protein